MTTLTPKTIYKKKEEPAHNVPNMYDLKVVQALDVPANKVLTYITYIDSYVDDMKRDIDALGDVRNALMKRAIAENIEEDFRAFVVKSTAYEVRKKSE